MILVDAHVHLHPRFPTGEFLDAAAENFASAAALAGAGASFTGVICLTESAQTNRFEALARNGQPESDATAGGWTFRSSPDGVMLQAGCGRNRTLWIAAGRQVVSSDGLEVLALCTAAKFRDRELPLAELVGRVLDTGALAVVPWGTGKWWGRRGRIVSDLIACGPRRGLFLGDNSGRPAFLAAHPHFDQATTRGIRILPGTDPLPFDREARRVGGNGIILNGDLDLSRPCDDLKARLTSPAAMLTPYGNRESLVRFVRNQIAMQWVKRFNGASPVKKPPQLPHDRGAGKS
ncbi:MAG: hypothetical protein WCL44_02670 [bacterium]